MIKPHTTLFISDLHLMQSEPKVTQLFFDFCAEIASKADSLYILGDFFEYWVGDDDHNEFNTEIINCLTQLSKAGVELFFMAGNRDFLLGQKFCDKTNMQLLDDPTKITIYGRDILLAHGDEFCRDDISHQRFRKLTRKKAFKKFFLSLPLRLRHKIANVARKKSKGSNYDANSKIGDVTEDAIKDAFIKYSVQTMVHGHTHRLGRHVMYIDGQACERIVLGDWHDSGSYLAITESGGCHLHHFPA